MLRNAKSRRGKRLLECLRSSFLLMTIHLPAQVLACRLIDRTRRVREVRRDVVLEAALADVVQELLKVGDLAHTRAAEGCERVVGEPALPSITRNPSLKVVCGEPREAHIA